MKTNNRQEKEFPITDKRGIGAVILTIANIDKNDTPGLDDVIDDNLRVDPPKPPADEPPTKDDLTKTPEQIAQEKEAAEKAAASIEAAKKHGGVRLDDQGNVLDAAGKVIKTAAEIAAGNEPTGVTIDGKDYKLDANGNALNDDGSLFKTKAEIDALEDDEELPLTVELIQKIGITPVDEKGNPKAYDETPEGVMALVNDVAEIKANETLNKRWDANPKAKAYYDHVLAGGTDEEFFSVIKDDFKAITLDDNNPEQQKMILNKLLVKRGFTPEKASKYIKQMEDANELKAEAKDALSELQTLQAKEEEALKQQNEARIKENQAKVEEHWNKVNEIVVKKGTIKGIVIPEVDRENFFKYMAFAANDKGQSAADIARAKEDLDTKLLIEYYRFRGYDVSNLVKEAVGEHKANSLRKRIAKSKNLSGTSGQPSGQGGGTGGTGEISLDTLMQN